MWRKGKPHMLQMKILTGSTTMEDSMEDPQKIKNRATIILSNTSSGYLPPKFESIKMYSSLCLLQHSQWPKHGNNVNVLLWKTG